MYGGQSVCVCVCVVSVCVCVSVCVVRVLWELKPNSSRDDVEHNTLFQTPTLKSAEENSKQRQNKQQQEPRDGHLSSLHALDMMTHPLANTTDSQ